MILAGCQKPLSTEETVKILEFSKIPEFHLKENTRKETLELLQKHFDSASPRKVRVTTEVYNGSNVLDPQYDWDLISMDLRNVSLMDLCKFIQTVSGMRYRIVGNKVIFFTAIDFNNQDKIQQGHGTKILQSPAPKSGL